MMKQKYDLAIVGGGIMGTSLAIALSDAGLDVALIDAKNPKHFLDKKQDGRGFAVAYGSKCLFETLGLWEGMSIDAETIKEIHVSEHGSLFFLHFDPVSKKDQAMGYLVKSERVHNALWQGILDRPKITHYTPEKVVSFESDNYGGRLCLESGTCIDATLVVAADGKNSFLRELVGIDVKRWSYPHHALVTTIKHQQPHNGIAYEHFFRNGPFAVLPLQKNHSSIVWCEPEDIVDDLKHLSEEQFNQRITEKFPYLGKCQLAADRISYPLEAMVAKQFTANRLALIGDAAHAIHPISGQGLNLGLRDVAHLAELIVDHHRVGLDIGSEQLLSEYAKRRKWDSIALVGLTDGLTKLFTNSYQSLHYLRTVGLGIVNKIPPLKKMFVKRAMGVGGKKPRLIQGQHL
jgi:2-octaprenyl-6-methoxyphenol hydroxylase